MNAVDRLIKSHPAHAIGGDENRALKHARQSALSNFQKTGFPSTKVEEWKYTSTKVLHETGFELDTQQSHSMARPAAAKWGAKGAAQLVFLNGKLQREWSHWPEAGELIITEINQGSQALLDEDHGPFNALNLAFVQDGFHIEVPDNQTLSTPIYLVFIGHAKETPLCSHPRVVLSVGQSSRATLIQTHVGRGDAPSWINAVVQCEIGANAKVRHLVIHEGGDKLHYIGNIRANVDRNGGYHSHTFWLGGVLSRNNLRFSLNAPGAETDL